jgi:hypothetical protein
MKSKIKIQNPCSEIWETMTDIPEGKFCEICSKKVWDFTEKSSEEIENILLENPKLCGRISGDILLMILMLPQVILSRYQQCQ